MQKSADTPISRPAGRRRGRPRAFDSDAVLAEATRLFWLKGFEATSNADLTAAIGIGAPSLYAACGSTEAVYAEAWTRHRNQYDAVAGGGVGWGARQRALDRVPVPAGATWSCGR